MKQSRNIQSKKKSWQNTISFHIYILLTVTQKNSKQKLKYLEFEQILPNFSFNHLVPK